MDGCVKLCRLDEALIHDDIYNTTQSIHFQGDHHLRDQDPGVQDQYKDSLDKDFELANKRAQLDSKLKKTFESIFEKYGKDFDGIGDEIDIATGEIVVNNGHVLFMHDEKDAGERNLQDDKQLLVENLSGDIINTIDEYSVFGIETTKEKCNDEKFKDEDESINSLDDQEEDDLILRGFFRANRYLQMKPKEETYQNCEIFYNSPHNYVSSCTLAGGMSLDSRPVLSEKSIKNKYEDLPVNETQIEKAWRVPDLPISQHSDEIESAWKVPCISNYLPENCKANVIPPPMLEDKQLSPPQKVKSLWAPVKLSVARMPDRLEKIINCGEKSDERVYESHKNRQSQINKLDWRTLHNACKNKYQALNSVEKRLLLDWVAKGRQEGLAEQRIFKEFRAKYPHRTLKAWKSCFQKIDPHLTNQGAENNKEDTSQSSCNTHESKEPKEGKNKPIIEVRPYQDKKNQAVSRAQKYHESSQSSVSPIDGLDTHDGLDHNLLASNFKQSSINVKSDIISNEHLPPNYQSPGLMMFEKQKANVIETQGSLFELHPQADSQNCEPEKSGQLIPFPKNNSCNAKRQLMPKKLFKNSLKASTSVGENCEVVSHPVKHLYPSDCHSSQDSNNLTVPKKAHTFKGSILVDDIISSQPLQIIGKGEVERSLTEENSSIQAPLATNHSLPEKSNEIDKVEVRKFPTKNSSKNSDISSQSNCKTHSSLDFQEVAIHQSETQSITRYGRNSEIHQTSTSSFTKCANSAGEESKSNLNNASKITKSLVSPLGLEEVDELSLGQKEILLISSEPRLSSTVDCKRVLGKEDPLQSPALKLSVRRRKKRKLFNKGEDIDELCVEHDRSHFDVQVPSLAISWPDIAVPRTKINDLKDKEELLTKNPSLTLKPRHNEGHPSKVSENSVSCSFTEKFHLSVARSSLSNLTASQKKMKSGSKPSNPQPVQELCLPPQNKSESNSAQEGEHVLTPVDIKGFDNHGKAGFKCGKSFCFQCFQL